MTQGSLGLHLSSLPMQKGNLAPLPWREESSNLKGKSENRLSTETQYLSRTSILLCIVCRRYSARPPRGFEAKGSSHMPERVGSRMASAKEVFRGIKMQHNTAEKILSRGINWEIKE